MNESFNPLRGCDPQRLRTTALEEQGRVKGILRAQDQPDTELGESDRSGFREAAKAGQPSGLATPGYCGRRVGVSGGSKAPYCSLPSFT